jgi:hypothetical protein
MLGKIYHEPINVEYVNDAFCTFTYSMLMGSLHFDDAFGCQSERERERDPSAKSTSSSPKVLVVVQDYKYL